jgi:murein L,D-transpeptidase YafK
LLLALGLGLELSRPAQAGPRERANSRDRAAREKVKDVRARREPDVRALFSRANVAYPAPRLFLRAHKQERELELWAGPRTGALTLVHTFPVCAASGELGPKRKRGDRQVPEGLYRITHINPASSFHLSLGINYPNAVDRLRSGADDPGNSIYIHGDCVSVGCLAIEDLPMELLFLAVMDAQQKYGAEVPVLMLPRRMDAEAAQSLAARAGEDAELAALWQALGEVDASFVSTRTPPAVQVGRRGSRALRPATRDKGAPIITVDGSVGTRSSEPLSTPQGPVPAPARGIP